MIKKLGKEDEPSSEEEGEGEGEEEEEEEELSEGEEEEFYRDLQVLLSDQIKNQQVNKKYTNDVEAIMAKLEEMRLKLPGHEEGGGEVPWKETLALTSAEASEVGIADPSEDLQRERVFYDLALKTAKQAYAKMDELQIPYNRPDDFFAEMVKSDTHMTKIKKVLLKEKRQIEQAQQRTKARMDRKFVKKTQVESQQKRHKEKKDEQEAIKKWRKTKTNDQDREFPEDLLNKKSDKRKTMSNSQKKALKYGMGGKRRGLKTNTKKSANDFSEWNKDRNKSTHFKGIPRRKSTGSIPAQSKPKASATRPGKRKRQEGWAVSGGKKVKRQSR